MLWAFPKEGEELLMNRGERTGQLSMEFLLILVILFFVLIFATWIFGAKNIELIDYNTNESAKLVAFNAAMAINNAHLAGDGFETELELDNFGQDFNLSVDERSVVVTWGDGFADYPLITDKVVVGDVNFEQMISLRRVDGNVFLG